ncbi:MAG: hypothetical protein OHK0017_11720 [Patescibacteria group bacterium]
MQFNLKQIPAKLAVWRDKNLNEPWKKYTAASVLALITLGAMGGLYLVYDSGLRDRLFNPNDSNFKSTTSKAVSPASFRLSNYEPDSVFYKKLSLEDLPIYPKGWVKGYFSEEEQANKNISGEKADPDNDGLSNKLELIYGSNPKKADTLGAGKKDKEYVDAGVNPLTGLSMDKQSYSFMLLQSDEAALKSINDSSEVLFNEGINLPKMYEEAANADFNTEVASINLTVAENPNRNQILSYLQQRAQLAQDSFGISFTQDLASIYKTVDKNELQKLEDRVRGQLNAFQAMVVPASEVNNHKAAIYFNQQLIKILELRKEYTAPDSKFDQSYSDKNMELVKRLVWAFRVMSVEVFAEGQGQS